MKIVIKNGIKMYILESLNKKKYNSKVLLGFWIYILSDCILFSGIFSVYVVLSIKYMNIKNLFNMYIVNLETLILLISSFTIGIVILFFNKNQLFYSLFFVLLLGVLFVILEINEIRNIYITHKINSLLSAYLTLVGIHCIHIIIGLYWGICLLFNILFNGLNIKTRTSLLCLSIFWHFLHIIWVCIYTIVYLYGLIK
ncbi:Cytochrome o ubiquinol oxidase subunit 3 [Candidatus Portiera aleyrodidarum]|uniref:cytochrome c oxidase subunit 3 n=1 Tax=Candidatus Portiera aleyrodidarum TaxID=91844 RepID=UPI0005D95865|nr:cytochrome c oxidase subunit 3 [Candidatus Portiera aleyrodidarum]CEL12409.1 Cytochrome o ubiquinol oxidase subunit 3 [Candidatus Portiera aleyrodidarum]